jgi:predicted signal transduction protein with EAL and GGDEF domain
VVGGRTLSVRVSIGVALGSDATKNPEDLLRDADTAMYQAKGQVTSGYRVFDPAMHERVLNRLGLEKDLRNAVEQEEFCLYYQPKIRLKEDDAIVEVEALLRWDDPKRGMLLPGEFISLAEETRLIVPLGGGFCERPAAG